MSPLRRLQQLGQSVWLDDLSRRYLDEGTLTALIERDGLSGITSNPAIFERAIGQSDIYDADIKAAAQNGESGEAIYERLVIEDIQGAADRLSSTYRNTAAREGYVSLEVSPHLADDTGSTVAEARRLWAAVDRPNVMIKVPGTRAGLPAIETLIAEGLNVNVTLLFSPSRYCEVVEAYWRGLERRIEAGLSPQGIGSVASFFVSRIDVLVDRIVDRQPGAAAVRGSAAVTAAALAYRHNLRLYRQRRWRELEKAGAPTQRLLWASTSTKDPQYSDIKYVEALIAADTINTMPMETLSAYRDHGEPVARLEDALAQAGQWQRSLEAQGIDIEEVAQQLEREGIQKFITPFEKLLDGIDRKRRLFLNEHS